MNPIIDSALCTNAVSDISLPNNLILEAKFKGFKLSIVPKVSGKSYYRKYCSDRNSEFSHDDLKIMKRELYKGTAVKNETYRVFELTRVSDGVMSAFIEFKISAQEINVEHVSISKTDQGKGVGTLLMKSIKEVASIKKILNVTLISESDVMLFYEKNGFKRYNLSCPLPLMKLSIAKRDHACHKTLECYDLTYSEAQILSPVPFKKA